MLFGEHVKRFSSRSVPKLKHDQAKVPSGIWQVSPLSCRVLLRRRAIPARRNAVMVFGSQPAGVWRADEAF